MSWHCQYSQPHPQIVLLWNQKGTMSRIVCSKQVATRRNKATSSERRGVLSSGKGDLNRCFRVEFAGRRARCEVASNVFLNTSVVWYPKKGRKIEKSRFDGLESRGEMLLVRSLVLGFNGAYSGSGWREGDWIDGSAILDCDILSVGFCVRVAKRSGCLMVLSKVSR